MYVPKMYNFKITNVEYSLTKNSDAVHRSYKCLTDACYTQCNALLNMTEHSRSVAM